MKELKVNEKIMQRLANQVEELISKVQGDIALLRDTEEDVYIRFTSATKMRTFLSSSMNWLDTLSTGMSAGYSISSSVLNTDKAKEEGWENDNLDEKISNSEFFIQEKNNDNFDGIPDWLKSALKESFVEMMKK